MIEEGDIIVDMEKKDVKIDEMEIINEPSNNQDLDLDTRPPPLKQKQLVHDEMTQFYEAGSKWFLVDKKWWDRWRSYVQWKNETSLIARPSLEVPDTQPLWETAQANRIHGTDATSFSPFMVPDSTDRPNILEAWVSDINRTAPLAHTSDVTVKGINLRRYTIAASSLLNSTMNPDNAAFRMNGPSGVLDLTSANSGVPIMLTKPHFLDTDSSVSSLIQGMSAPNRDDHDTYIDVEPLSGIMMNGAKRLQINVDIHPVSLRPGLLQPVVTWFPDMRTMTLLPAIWVEESGSIGDSSASAFKNQVLLLTNFASLSYYIFYAFGNFLVLIGIYLFFTSVSRKTNDGNGSINNNNVGKGDRFFNEPLLNN